MKRDVFFTDIDTEKSETEVSIEFLSVEDLLHGIQVAPSQYILAELETY